MAGKPGWHQTDEAKAKIRAAKLGTRHTPEAIARIRAAKANAPRGEQHPCWKGGLTKGQGRVRQYVDLGKSNGNYVLRARVVAEQMIGRPLRSDEHVHHKNGITDDDRPENLEVLPRPEHARHHAFARPYDPETGRWL